MQLTTQRLVGLAMVPVVVGILSGPALAQGYVLQLHPSLLGAVVGAVLGGIGRGALAAFYVRELNRDTTLVVLVVAAIGVVVGALSGMTGRPVWGAVVGAALSAVVYLATLPVALFMQTIQVGRAPLLVEVLVDGALVGALAGAAGRIAQRRR